MCSARRRSASTCERHAHRRLRRLQGRAPIRPARRSSWCRATCSSPRRRSGCRCSVIGDAEGEIAKLLHSVALFPERAHLVGAYSLGKAQRVIALMREAGYDKPIYLHGAMEKITRYYESRGIDLGELRAGARRRRRRSSPAPSRSARLGAAAICGRGVFPIRSSPSRPAGCACARARASAASTLPLVISDHADWDGLTATIAATGASEIWVTHGQEDALVHWCATRGLEGAAARHRRLWRRG